MTIEERIERLERTNRRYRRMFTLIGVLAVCAVGISAAQDEGVPKVIRAKVFQVVSDDGHILAMLTGIEGQGTLSIWDKKGHPLAGMASVTVDGKRVGQVSIYREGQALVSLGGYPPDGERTLMMFNDQGKTVVSIRTTANGSGSVITSDAKGKPLVELGATEDGEGLVTVSGHNGKGRTLKPGPDED